MNEHKGSNLISDEDYGYQSQPTTAAVAALQPLDISHFKTKKIQRNNQTLTILLQNSNGPCALLAIVNCLILAHSDIYQGLSQYVAYSEIVEVSELLKYLVEIIHTAHTLTAEEAEIVLQLLPTLNTGLSINPKFDGSFEQTRELLIFKAFGLQVAHGWIISPEADIDEYHTIIERYPSYESAQQCLIDAYDINERAATATPQELQIIEDSHKVRAYFAKCGTQLTEYGLSTLSRHLTPGQMYVFFRNNHFNTIVRDGMEIFQLLTDLGFAEKSEYVWESLLSINGTNNSFFKGDFQPIFVRESQLADDGGAAALHSYDQMEDEDRALAMAIQEEEDQRAAKALQKRYQKPNAAAEGQTEGQTAKKDSKKKGKKDKKGKKKSSCVIL
ncbi:hypothetical protein WICPIJ_002806 [Wickerhamomyces pijperi]|uniref:MINDY deubiquitinase domain-containing protein n=1 Tax=Wickerhamomyces pijperi TaxID=599730 RepID=A0A9P8QB53_WICPI|nr:hypothetical protein WICPIJ_002806 [Wickerhamomyces pijperi]